MRLTIKEKVVRRLEGIREDFKIREIFKHKGRTCVVVEVHMGIAGNWHNGYVETINNFNKKRYNQCVTDIETDELTFSGSLYSIYKKSEFKGKKFAGFDSGHYWNTKTPESQTFGEVKKRTIKLCKEMIRKGL